MIAIADSGATKTDWALLEKGQVAVQAQTIGFNPYFISTDGILEELEKNLYPYLNIKQVTEVHFYGAGCSTPTNCDIVRNALEDFFTQAEIHVEHDLLGAAHALLGREKGIACILGTGSNSCSYDGYAITQNINSLGYVLADEGSGAYLGKQLIRDYFLDELPQELKIEFDRTYQMSLEHVLNAVYKQPYPNRFLASFSMFLAKNMHHGYIRQLLLNAFHAFFTHQVIKYKDYNQVPVRALGSVAWHYKDLFIEAGKAFGARIDKVLINPMDGLVGFHRGD